MMFFCVVGVLCCFLLFFLLWCSLCCCFGVFDLVACSLLVYGFAVFVCFLCC